MVPTDSGAALDAAGSDVSIDDAHASDGHDVDANADAQTSDAIVEDTDPEPDSGVVASDSGSDAAVDRREAGMAKDGGVVDAAEADATATTLDATAHDAGPDPDVGADAAVADASMDGGVGGAPADPTLTLFDRTSLSETFTNEVQVGLRIEGDPTAAYWAADQFPFPPSTNPQDVRWRSTEPSEITVGGREGSQTVYAWVMDAQLRINPGVVSATIVLDTTPPAAPALRWQWENPTPVGADLKSVWTSSTASWAVGHDGTILRIDPNGTAQTEDAPGLYDLESITGDPAGMMWAAGSAGLVIASSGDGRWTVERNYTGNGDDTLRAIATSGNGVVYAAGRGRVLERDGAGQWTTHLQNASSFYYSVVIAQSGDVWAGGTNGLVMRRDATTGLWNDVSTGGTETIDALSTLPNGEVLASGGTTVYHWTGASWVAESPGFGVRNLAPGDAGETHAVGVNEAAVRSASGQWTLEPRPAGTRPFLAVSRFGGYRIAVGENGEISTSTAAASWSTHTVRATSRPAALNSLWAAGPNVIYAAGDGFILRSTGDGDWTTELAAGTTAVASLSGAAPNDVYAIGSSGAAWRSTGNGMWSSMTPVPNSPRGLHEIWAASSGDVYVGGENGQIIHWDNTGWLADSTPSQSDVGAITGRSPNELYAIVRQGGAVWFSAGTGSWTPHPAGAPRSSGGSLAVIGNDLYAAANAFLYRLDGPGWVLVPTGLGAEVNSISGAGGYLYASSHAGDVARIVVGSSSTRVDTNVRTLNAMTALSGDNVLAVGDDSAIVRLSRGLRVADPMTGHRGRTAAPTVDIVWPTLSAEISEVLVSDTQSTVPATTSPGWTANAPSQFTFTNSTPGTRVLYVWVRDEAGNVAPDPMIATIEL